MKILTVYPMPAGVMFPCPVIPGIPDDLLNLLIFARAVFIDVKIIERMRAASICGFDGPPIEPGFPAVPRGISRCTYL